MSAENLSPAAIRSPDRPARSESYRLSYPGPGFMISIYCVLLSEFISQCVACAGMNGMINIKLSVLKVSLDK
jgi:hypothetical protein